MDELNENNCEDNEPYLLSFLFSFSNKGKDNELYSGNHSQFPKHDWIQEICRIKNLRILQTLKWIRYKSEFIIKINELELYY